ncbi:MAG: hypothetical protein ACXABY_29840, partial [Candidatus Thorarchaeota archaeon]
MHRRIGYLFPTPWNLRDAILNGHEYGSSREHVIVSELPLVTDRGSGKADITLLERVVTKDGKQVLYRPALICEIKTRMGHQWYLDAELKLSKSRGKKEVPHRVVADFPMKDRLLEDSEWKAVVDSTPRKETQEQITIYADAIAKKFGEITGEEPGHVYRATIIIESISDIHQVRRIIEGLVTKAYEHLKKINGDIKRTEILPSNVINCNIALVIHNQKVSEKSSREIIEISWSPPYNPLHEKHESNRRLILYLTGESPTSAGQSAAWNARYYHGLQTIYQISKAKSDTRCLWLDLTDQFVELRLAEARLHLRPRRYTPDEEAKAHHEHIRKFFEEIEVNGHLDDILSYIYEDGPEPSFGIEKISNKPILIIVSGIDFLRNATPETHRDKLQIILDRVLSSIPDDETTTVFWFDSPVPSADKSMPYATRVLLPYYSSSSLAENTTEIIWNLPTPPRSAVEPEKWTLSSISDTPIYDDIRLIVTHTSNKVEIQFESISLLQGWSKRFKNQGRGLVIRERKIEDTIPEKNLRDRLKLLSLTLIPWIVKFKPNIESSDESNDTLEEQFDSILQEFRGKPEDLTVSIETRDRPPSKAPRTLDFLRFRQPDIRSGKAYVAMTLGRINSQRLYRSPIKMKTAPRDAEGISIIDRELQTDWILGVKFVSEDEPAIPWWMIIQDPKKSSRVLVGCFLNK